MLELFPLLCQECGHPVGYSTTPPDECAISCKLCITEFAIVHHTLMIHAEKFSADLENDLRHIQNRYDSHKRREEYHAILMWSKKVLDKRTALQIEKHVLDNLTLDKNEVIK